MIQLRMPQQIFNRAGHTGFLIPCAEDNPLHPGQDYGASAHRARLKGDVESAVVQSPAIELGRCLADGEKLRVRGGILITNRPVGRGSEDRALAHYDRPDRYLVSLDRVAGEVERVSYVLLVDRQRRCGNTKWFARRFAIWRQALALSLS